MMDKKNKRLPIRFSHDMKMFTVKIGAIRVLNQISLTHQKQFIEF